MRSNNDRFVKRVAIVLPLLLLNACVGGSQPEATTQSLPGFEVKLLVGSALGKFCEQASQKFNQQQPKLTNGKQFYITCTEKGSGDVVTTVLTQAKQFKAGTLTADAPDFPTIISVDGEIYLSQLIYQMNQLFPGQSYIPDITESPLLANSPMVLMAQADVARGLRKAPDPYKALAIAKTHRDIDASAPPLVIHYVQTAPTRSNSGLQTLVAQFADVSGKRPEQLTVADVTQYQTRVQQLQSKVTRYGASTNSLAKAIAQNGPFWASVGSVYESSVITVNSALPPGHPRYEAIYPKATFSSNMRAIVPRAPWITPEKKEAAETIIAYLRSPDAQKIATDLGLRPGVPGIPLGPKFSPEFGVMPQPQYDSYRPPTPPVVEAMLKSWQVYAKKPSQVVIVVDTSGSMAGTKLAAVQQTLQTYINNLGPKETIALVNFSSDISDPVVVDGTPAGRDRGLQFISGLQAKGDTRLYDAVLYARNWLQQHPRQDAINAVLVLTDGEDTRSSISLDQLGAELKKSGFNSDQRIAFFTIGYGKEGEFNPKALQEIASLNAGYFAKGDPETIGRLMSDVQVEF